MKRYAAIDIGSQTIRLLIAECDDEVLYPLERDREIAQLGSGMHQDGLLRPDRCEHAVACIQKFCERARRRGVQEILAVATACVRQAHNRQSFLERVRQAAGITLAIISGRQEAELSCAGVQAILPAVAPAAIIIDIGGGSTELSFLAAGLLQNSTSLPLGVIAPAERCMHTDPPTDSEIEAIRAYIESIIPAGPADFPHPGSRILPVIIATAGTATTLAAMDLKLRDYAPSHINGHQLTCASISKLLQTMLALPLAERSALPGLEPGRARVIIPGTLILLRLLQYFGSPACTVSDAGLLEGIVIRHATLKKIIEKT